jgi:hypothetical protein
MLKDLILKPGSPGCTGLLELLLCLCLAGCGSAGPLVIRANSKNVGPWCATKQRVQIGQRVVGRVADGDKWQNFLVDDTGKEHDPRKIAEEVWSYLEKTGDAQKIKEAFQEGHYPSMSVVSIKPVVVILETNFSAGLPKQIGSSPERWYWTAQIYTERQPVYRDELKWFSPDLKQRPTSLTFSQMGVAEIALTQGTLKLIREGERCRTLRE